jgi:hypothetical protein
MAMCECGDRLISPSSVAHVPRLRDAFAVVSKYILSSSLMKAIRAKQGLISHWYLFSRTSLCLKGLL